jgi:tRNA (cytidine/uridine-2'-O-)-methyltransferase
VSAIFAPSPVAGNPAERPAARLAPPTVFDIVLYEPEIPPNTGNAMRLCANIGARLHLIEPLGFVLSDRRLRRAGLDYRDRAEAAVHASLAACRTALGDRRWFALSTRGQRSYDEVRYRANDVLLFGPETRGLPADVLAGFDAASLIRLPMVPTSRSLNLANAVAIVAYEAWRQNGFLGSQPGNPG